MKKQHLALLLLLNLGLLFSAKTQTVLREFVDLKKIEQLSSNNEESMPFPYLNGTKMYFVRTIIVGSMKQRMTGQDIWSSEFDGDSWASPSNLFDEANDNGNNAVIGVSNDGNTLYLFNSVQTRRKLAQGIAVTRRDPQGNWSDLEQVDVPGFKVGQGLYSLYVAPNEKTLLIGMSVSDSSTQSDLFVSLKNEEGNWGELKDLGSTINTEGTEITPFIGEDGTSLYFSSDGHKGMGGMDVFTAQRLDDSWANWTTPVNLGAPVNSDEFDAYFMLCNNKEAVLTSNRAGLFSDIYWTTLKQEKEEKIAAKEVRVLAQMYFKKGPAKGIDLLILDVQGNLIEKITTNEKGEFSFPEAEDQTYNVQLDSPDSSLQADANIYLTDDYGFKLERLNRNTEGVYTDIVSQQEAEKVEGIFEYKSSPQENVTLIVYDENNFPIDTLVTDAQGKFIYKKLKADNNFTIRPLMFSEDNLVDNMEIFTTDSSGEKLDKVVVNTTKVVEEAEKEIFLAKLKEEELAAKKDEILALSDNNQASTSSHNTTAENTNKAALQSSDQIIYFDFNQRVLTADDKVTLNKIINSLKNNTNFKVTMIGFTDNIGSVENNVTVASARARAARAYLTENGVSLKRITIYGYGEVMFKADNSTDEGRALNRRVEIELK